MKVTLVNKDDTGGGAAMASLRLFKALKANKLDVSMLVQKKTVSDADIHSTIHSKLDKYASEFNFLYERLSFVLKEREKAVRFAFSEANAGSNITKEPVIKNADILHLHWINGGFLSLNNLNNLLKLNKLVVWTLHDMWPFTGGCHYPGHSEKFLSECGNCHFLKHPAPNDISHSGWVKKHKIYNNNKKITYIACSNWMREMAQKSSLLQGNEIVTIANPIDVDVFSKQDKVVSRRQWNIPEDAEVILFGSANINHTRKGIKYLIEALHKIKQTDSTRNIRVVVFGKSKDFDFNQIPFPVISLPVIHTEVEIAEVYSLADVFILPSLEDNLPNMVMEALSCSTPVVAFNTGGVKDMVDHNENGYLAEYMSAEDLAKGILSVLNDSSRLAVNARRKVVENFSFPVIAEKHIQLYERLLT
ncbi:MAG: glycosyltransferase family 4 protein [Sphingobacteriaceae bacterium]